MKDFFTGVARTEVYLSHSSTSEKAVNVALNAKFNYKVACYGAQENIWTQMIRLSQWTLVILRKVLDFKLLSSNIASVDVTCAKARGIFALAARRESNASIGRVNLLPQALNLAWLESANSQ